MSWRILYPRILSVCLALAALAACDARSATRVLFIGNSYTVANGGIDKQLKGLAPSTETTCLAVGGYTLEKHWTDGKPLQTIRQGVWDYVVLQEQSQTPVFDRKKFHDFAQEFDNEIRRNGAKTILLMTWERPDSRKQGVTAAGLAEAYTAVGAELEAKVAPAGTAFARSLRDRPELMLYSQDGHPTIEGTYLAACVLYATIFGRTPVGNSYSDKNISADTRAYLQWKAVEALGSLSATDQLVH